MKLKVKIPFRCIRSQILLKMHGIKNETIAKQEKVSIWNRYTLSVGISGI